MELNGFELEDNKPAEGFHFQYKDEEIIKRIDSLENKIDKVLAAFDQISKETANIFFYKPTYACKDDYIKIRNGKILLKATLIGFITSVDGINDEANNEMEPPKLYVPHISDKYLADKIKTLCYDSNDKLVMATFVKSVNEDNCYILRNCHLFKTLKYPLTFIKD